jgi:hypothetical protein
MTPLNIRLGFGVSSPAPGIDITPAGIIIGYGPANCIKIDAAGVSIISPQVTCTSPGMVSLTSTQSVKVTGADVTVTGSASAKMAAPNIKSVFATSIFG